MRGFFFALKMRKIAIQGIRGSNHHIVANKYYGTDIALNECLSFDVLTDSLLQGHADEAVMAIENTIPVMINR